MLILELILGCVLFVSLQPIQHNTVHMGAFQAQEKELVFDIDLTDYDDVRECCRYPDLSVIII